ncbi:MAG: N-acetylmuramoyl-L-alanine amidase [Alphaproteobacteria bacterium]|nr:N-acetylmuramoyl-L-alanine amidase [Alphaproteobacteria bacterium]
MRKLGHLIGTAVLAAASHGALASDGADFGRLARGAGEPQVPGLRMVYLSPLGDPAAAPWKHIILHQTEGPAGSARGMANAQARHPAKRGATLWVETDGTVYWATPETAVTLHGDGANRNDNKYIDNSKTYRQVTRANSIGVEFVGNFPDVRRPPTEEQFAAMLVLVRFLQERYGIPPDRVYAHNWIDYKDHRYCEGCSLAERARAQGYRPGLAEPKTASGVAGRGIAAGQ